MTKTKDSSTAPHPIGGATALEIALNSVPHCPFNAVERGNVVYFTGPDRKRYKATIEEVEPKG